MFKRKKKEVKPPKVIPTKNPPKVLKELKTYRIVLNEVPLTDREGDICKYEKELVLEEKNKNAMEEPLWVTKTRDIWRGPVPVGVYGFRNHSEELMWSILRELLLND